MRISTDHAPGLHALQHVQRHNGMHHLDVQHAKQVLPFNTHLHDQQLYMGRHMNMSWNHGVNHAV